MVKKLLLFSVLGIIVFLPGCFLGKDDVLTMQRKNLESVNLNLSGYYYLAYGNEKEKRKRIYFLYKNGIVLYGGTPSSSQLRETEEGFKTSGFYDFVKVRKYHWGIYTITGNKIKIERWNPGKPPLRAFIEEGTVLNDSTFHIDKFYWSNKNDGIEEEDRTYHFKPFSPKPDSTNTFIK